jgi:hypothetical protein
MHPLQPTPRTPFSRLLRRAFLAFVTTGLLGLAPLGVIS